MAPDEIKSRMNEMSLLPSRPWNERPLLITSTQGIFEPYVPPEGDGKMSALSLSVCIEGVSKASFCIDNNLYLSFQGAKQSMELLTKKTTSSRAISKIRKYDDDFESKEVTEKAK